MVSKSDLYSREAAPLAERMEKARQEAQKQIDSGMIQGAVIGVVGAPITAVGLQCVHPVEKPMKAHSRFDIASVGKVFTAACCGLLAVEGELELDAPFTKYLPEHVLGKNCDITVRDLAMMVSGFDNSKPYQPHADDMEFFNREFFNKRPVRPRLEAFEYSCYNFILLGKIVERIMGKDLDAAARELVWDPLGMSRTTWIAPGDGEDEVEHWLPNRPAGRHNDTCCYLHPFPLGCGSCFSTARDLLLFAQDILWRGQFPGAYYDLITTCGFSKNGIRRSFGWFMSESQHPKGLSSQTISHNGYTGQTICVDPETQFASVILTSRTGDHDEAIAGRRRIMEEFIGCGHNDSPVRWAK